MYKKGYKINVTYNAVSSDQLFRICGTRSLSDDAIGIATITAPVFLIRRNGLALRDDTVRIAAVAASVLLVGGGSSTTTSAAMSKESMLKGAITRDEVWLYESV